MGEVWRALDTRKGRDVALKLIRADLSATDDFAIRFRREAELAAQLSSPYLVAIHDYGDYEGQLFIDMALVEGIDLEGLIRQTKRLPVERAVTLVEQAARALSVAHRAGLVHRDVKPSNVLVADDDDDEHAYLIDFGIARALDGTRLTRSGEGIGTLAYMAPERFSGQCEQAADIYALACVLYEAVTGEKPFPVTSTVEMIAAHLNTPPPRASDRPGVPAALDEVIARGMAKIPSARYSSASKLAAAAQLAITVPAPGARTVLLPAERPSALPAPRPDLRPWLRRAQLMRRAVIMGTCGAVLLAGGLFGFRLWALEQSYFYVGSVDGKVAIFRGLHGNVLGVPLHAVDEQTDIALADLPADKRGQIAEEPTMGGPQAKLYVETLLGDWTPRPPKRTG